jgi:hypothetical protein
VQEGKKTESRKQVDKGIASSLVRLRHPLSSLNHQRGHQMPMQPDPTGVGRVCPVIKPFVVTGGVKAEGELWLLLVDEAEPQSFCKPWSFEESPYPKTKSYLA